MTVNKILKAILICLVLLKISYSQEISSAVLIDELETSPCGEYWARMDGFFVALDKDPLSKGYIVIYGRDKELLRNLTYEGLTNGIIKFRKFDKNRIEIVRGVLGEQRKIQFWKVLPGQSAPEFRKADWSYYVPASTKPFIFDKYSWIGMAACPSSPSPLKNYADLLLANQTARGHLVVRAKTNRKIRETEKEVLNELVGNYKLPRSRLKIFHVKEIKYQSAEADVEFWFVP
jgi:hypothetical protein